METRLEVLVCSVDEIEKKITLLPNEEILCHFCIFVFHIWLRDTRVMRTIYLLSRRDTTSDENNILDFYLVSCEHMIIILPRLVY